MVNGVIATYSWLSTVIDGRVLMRHSDKFELFVMGVGGKEVGAPSNL